MSPLNKSDLRKSVLLSRLFVAGSPAISPRSLTIRRLDPGQNSSIFATEHLFNGLLGGIRTIDEHNSNRLAADPALGGPPLAAALGAEPLELRVLRDRPDGRWPSDHFPVYARLALPPAHEL